MGTVKKRAPLVRPGRFYDAVNSDNPFERLAFTLDLSFKLEDLGFSEAEAIHMACGDCLDPV